MNRPSTPFSSSTKLGGDMSSTNSPQVTEPPSMILSFSPRSRRGSLASLSGSSVIDKEQLAQALNAIHNTASQSETLTTFNEFASPPSASSPSENKGIAGDLLHNGFSGLYSRFRGAVGAGKDKSGPAAAKDTAKVDGDSPDSSSIRSQKTTTTATKPSSNGYTKDVSVTTASSVPLSRSSSRQSPTATSFTSVGKPGLSHISKATPSSSLAPVSVTAGNERGRLKETSESIISRVSEHSLAIRDSSNFMSTSQASDSGYVNTDDNSLTQESSAAPWSSRTAVGVDGPSDVAGAAGNEPRARSALSNGSQAIESRAGLLYSERLSNHAILADSKRSNAIERITQAHLPNYLPSRTSSTDRSVATTSPVTTSAHNSLYHEVVGSDDWPGGPGPRHIPGTTTNEGNPEVVSARLEQMRKQVLSKEYWMADELCKECFLCGDNFTAFRRKHHCRTCGCIFDSKCTSIISGERFGVNGSLRVCKTCLDIINRRHDSSDSDDSGDDTVLPTSFFRPRLPRSEGTEQESRSMSIDDMPVSTDMAASRPLATPMMAIPATRRIGDSSNRRSAVLEIDAPQLSRPSSSRSLKSLTSGRPPSSGHRRYQSRHNFLGRFRSNTEQRAPFHRDPVDERKHSRLPAFHDDNIIDPDLAPYMSDEGSSGDEQMSIFAAMNSNDVSSPRVESERTGFSTLLGPGKKHRSRAGDKSVGGVSFVSRPNDDNGSMGSFMGHTRPTRRRNVSASSNNIHHGKGSPRQNKVVNFMKGVEDVSEEYSGSFENLRETSSPGRGPNKMTRSVSMRDANAPVVELNNASLHHVRRLLHQMLQDANIPNVPSWEKALIPILLRCTDDVNPDVRNGDDIDIRHYVKLKRVPGGKPGDTAYVSGVVFTKNLALKSMPRSISHPRIVIVSFPIEYQRHQQHFMSLEPVIAQEKEFLRNMVNRIASLRPQLVLVQKHISGLALQYLSEANIAVAYNVKQSVIEAVSRCAQTEIISSIDMVALKPVHVGKSTGFDVKTYVHQDIPGRKKTCIYISGCPKELGCTIVLRGASMPVLHQMKRITEFMVYVVYNLKLETCLMRDEFVLLPSIPDNGGSLSPGRQQASNAMATESNEPATARFAIAAASDKMHAVVEASKKLQQLQSSNGDGGGNQPGAQEPARSSEAVLADEKSEAPASIPPSPKLVSAHASHAHDTPGEDAVPEDIPMPTFYSDMVAKHQTKILSASPFVKFMQPYLLVRAREQERRLIYLKRLRDQDTFEDLAENEKATPQKFQLIQPEMVHATVQGAPKSIMEILHAVHDAEYDKALHNYETQKRQWENYIQGNLNLFDPYAHQNIVVLYTVVCTATTVPCAGPELLALAFYNEHETIREFDPDCTLGQYVEDLCLSVDTVCTSNGCERKMTEHHRTYVHGEARITVFLEKTTCKIKGLQDSILMWSYCKICKKESQVMPMSESTWKYSFGKYLELSFWSTELHLRAGFCPHDLHKDHLRYFGYRNVAMRIHYDPIDLLEIVVPRTRITWKVDKDLRLKNELFTKSEERWNRFMASVKSRIKGININNVGIENAEACKAEVDKLTKRAHDEHSALLRKLQEKYMESKYYEIIPLNRAVRAMQEKVAEWDSAFADFDSNYFPSEKDIRRLATLQLKKMFMDSNSSSTSLTSLDTIEQSDIDEQSNFTVDTDTLNTSKEDSQDASQSSVGETSPETSNDNAHAEPSSESSLDHERDGVQHLDLAVTHSNQNNEAVNEVTPTMESNNPLYHNNAVSEPALNEDPPSPTPITPVETSLSEKVMLLRKASHASSGAGVGNSESSGIPKPSDRSIMRRSGSATSPPINRTQSQPIATLRRLPPPNHRPFVTRGESKQGMVLDIPDDGPRNTAQEPAKERKITDRLLGLGKHRKGHHSLIPRSIQGKRKDSKVANLANIYEQISREFEKERMRDRRQQAAKVTQSRAFPKASSKPIVEVYRDVNAAVEEQGHPEDDLSSMEPSHLRSEPSAVVEGLARTNTNTEHESATSPTNTAATAEETATEPETDDNQANASQTASDDENGSDVDHSLIDGMPDVAEIADSLGSSEPSTELELPKHEKSSLMKMLTNFWAERSASGWTQLEYPLSASDHVFVDSDVIVREDEPSSLIAFALSSEDYVAKLETIRRQGRPSTSDPNAMMDPESPQSYFDNPDIDQTEVETSLLRATGTHLKYQFAEGSAKMLCKIFYAEQFDAVRRKCGVSDRIVESLSRCLKWDSKGGKTKSVFLKTLDDRLVLKSLSPIETQAFLRFAPAYFNIMAEALFHDLPTVIAKMLGFYQIVIKNPVTGTEIKWDVLVMENLFYDRSPTRIFDLKGSMRNRKIQSTGEQNEVLLDENMVEFIYESPLFAREHSKKLLRASVWNDTLFLARQDVMDYSLMVAVDEDRKELVVGIIDCIRTYTWDKKLESWIKDRGFAGGNRNRPTVTSPKEYKSRFREAMARYVLQAPNCWHQFTTQPDGRQSNADPHHDALEEKTQDD